MNEPVGYCIYLPPGYDASSPDWRSPRLNGGDRRYPVVYYLHGGRPGSELLGAGMASFVADAMEAGTVPPAIYVFVNGGPLSHYNYPHDTACVFAVQSLPWWAFERSRWQRAGLACSLALLLEPSGTGTQRSKEWGVTCSSTS
jgi:hypothetical protein